MSEERGFTLDEARRELARHECALHGHDWDILQKMGGEPYAILCSRCGRMWNVAQGGKEGGK